MLVIPSRRPTRPELPLFRKRVSIDMGHSFFVGAYTKVFFKLRGYTLEDLEFRLPDGPQAGVVSLCRDANFDPERPDVMLCLGYRPGTYVFQVVDRATNVVVAEKKFELTTDWADEKTGPSLSVVGVVTGGESAPAWGGGPAGPDPQNLNVLPQSGTRRIAIILVDTSSQRYPTDTPTLDAIRQRWMDEIINGVTVSGQTRSSRRFFQEVSYNNFDISAQIFGPYQLSGNFDSYFTAVTRNGNTLWSPNTNYHQACITAADSDVNWGNFDTVLCVSQNTATQNAWPYASIGTRTYTTAEGSRNLGVISMPVGWGDTFEPTRAVHETFAHELGHNLGLSDQYTPDVPGRNPVQWDHMDSEDGLAHFSLAHRMMLGWVPAGWLKTYNFALGGSPVNETISLSAIQAGTPPAGRMGGIEVRVADGWNYYVEYRNRQATHASDQELPTNNAVLVTDVDSSPDDAPISRPRILRVANDPDGDGSVLTNGLNYRAVDVSDPTFPTDFRLSVSSIDGTKADVKVEYGVNSRPDPSIRPWPASPTRQWQSPDIEVRNTRNAADPAWFNVPWAGNPNTVVARVRNNGNLAAPNVRVLFSVKNYNVGGAPETPLGEMTQTIPALGTVEFTTTWNPPGNGHYCIIVRIDTFAFVAPDGTLVTEMSPHNNLAQSNYDRFISAEGSPATRQITFVEVGNPYNEATRVFIRPGQSNPLYRTYLGATSLLLEPGETRRVEVMYEYDSSNVFRTPMSLGKYGWITPEKRGNEGLAQRAQKLFGAKPNRVDLAAFIEDPRDPELHTAYRFSGAEAEIVTGRRTKFDYFYKDGGQIGGRVVLDNRRPTGVNGGRVLLIYRNTEDPKNPLTVYDEVRLDWDGRFVVKTSKKGLSIRPESLQAYYLPTPGFGDCYSAVIPFAH